MYSNQNFDEKITVRKRNEDYDLCNTEIGQKFILQWSPQNGGRYLSRNRYASPRSLSKSVPRRNRGIVRYNINRSLNFDIGTCSRVDSFKSPNLSSDSNISADNDNYLSRSAKILRALNIDYSPLKSVGLGIHKINKSLNFDTSLNAKSLMNINKSMRNGSMQHNVSPLSKINKTLNFETSLSESSIHSRLESSVESIDENQNQTPSQRNRKAKKYLNYPSPKFESKNRASPNITTHSAMLRSDMREKIDDIIQSNKTPNLQSSKRNLMKNKFNDFGVSTPRNLFNDFHDDDSVVVEDQGNGRPQTPENFIKIIPESMSAIKKSHKKERVLGRLGKAIAYQAAACSGSESFIDIAMDIEPEENRPTTLFFASGQYNGPHCGINSSNQSHKKDKNKRKSHLDDSEDEMSETGSIFDYMTEANAISGAHDFSKIDKNAQGTDISERRDSHVYKKENYQENSSTDDKVSNYVETATLIVDSGIISSSKAIQDADQLEIVQGACTQIGNASTSQTNDRNAMTTPEKSTGNSLRPGTPENRINFLQHIMTDSIKKSHKKIKDSNKKMLFTPRTIQDDAKEDKNFIRSVNEDNAITGDGNRAATPENTNSSRLLLSQFSSVKKSHRKGKHRRMLSGSLQCKKMFDREGEAASSSDCEIHDYSVSSSISDFPSLSPPRISLDSAKPSSALFGQCQKTNSNEFSSSDNSSDTHYHSLEGCSFDNKTCEIGIDPLLNSDFHKSSPNKRKNVSNDSLTSVTSQSYTNQGSISRSYESAEEFKIFTPIKKRKSFNLVAPIARSICDRTDLSPENGKLSEGALIEYATLRCSTPTTAGGGCLQLIENSFKTPDRGASGIFVTITDYSMPVLVDTENASGDSSGGRATPQNRSTAVLMVGINSIKKSHKKDKRSNVSRRFLISAREKEYEAEFTSSFQNDSSKSWGNSPRPSTSCENGNECAIVEAENETGEQAKTPPNCLQAKNHLRFLQTESIKRSHKKVRERKKYRSIVVDSEFSDDGSILNEAERSINGENEGLRGSENEKSKNTGQIYALRSGSPEKNFVATSSEGKERQFQGLSRSSGNLSDDGSIFDSEEKLKSPYKSGNGIDGADTIQF